MGGGGKGRKREEGGRRGEVRDMRELGREERGSKGYERARKGGEGK